MNDIEEKAKDFFSELDNVVAFFLFGSQANGRTTKESDIDFAVLFSRDKVPDSMKLIEYRESLSEMFKREVDLVCLNTASPIIGVQVIKNGKQLLVNDRKAFNQYVIDLYTDYADLKRLRRPIEESILKRKYYG